MDHADDDGNNNDDGVFVYMGGDQEVPRDATHVRVHKSVKIITARAFMFCRNLVSIEMHDGVEIIGERTFYGCWSLRGTKLSGVRVIGKLAFHRCRALAVVEFGNKLETIDEYAFTQTSLRSIKLPKVRLLENGAFAECHQLTEVELSEDLERIGRAVFYKCSRLRRIAMPLKDNMFQNNDYVFSYCDNLSPVDLVGGIHKTVSSLLLGSWRNEMNNN